MMLTVTEQRERQERARSEAFRREQVRILQRQLSDVAQRVSALEAELRHTMIIAGLPVEPVVEESSMQVGVHRYGGVGR